MNLQTRIKMLMRQNELELLHHLRKHRVTDTWNFSKAWHNALDRLMAKKKVVYRKGCYVAVKNARPVTPWQRPKPKRVRVRRAAVVAPSAPVVLLRVRVNGAGSFQMVDPNSRNRHWERSGQ